MIVLDSSDRPHHLSPAVEGDESIEGASEKNYISCS